MMEGPWADSEEKREPVSDIDTAVADSLKVLDPNRPIREADINGRAKPAGRGRYRKMREALWVHPFGGSSRSRTRCVTAIS